MCIRDSARVATRVAERLDVPCVDLFEATRKACASSSSAKPSGLGVSRQDSVDPWAEPEVAASPTKRGDDETQTQAPDVFVDGVHFSAFGQELVFQALTERIRRTQTTVHAHAHTKEPGGDAVLSLDPESMDPDWPFGPALRGAPEAWRDAMVAHARGARKCVLARAYACAHACYGGYIAVGGGEGQQTSSLTHVQVYISPSK